MAYSTRVKNIYTRHQGTAVAIEGTDRWLVTFDGREKSAPVQCLSSALEFI